MEKKRVLAIDDEQIVLDSVRKQLRLTRKGLAAEVRSYGDLPLAQFLAELAGKIVACLLAVVADHIVAPAALLPGRGQNQVAEQPGDLGVVEHDDVALPGMGRQAVAFQLLGEAIGTVHTAAADLAGCIQVADTGLSPLIHPHATAEIVRSWDHGDQLACDINAMA